jgi:hypothetical protein
MATIYYSLYDRMLSKGNLYQGYLGVKKAKGSAGIDRQTIADFEENLEARACQIICVTCPTTGASFHRT